MKLNTVYLLFLCGLLCPCTTCAQDYFYNNHYYESDFLFETGVSIGGINCLTDIGGNPGPARKFMNDVNWCNTRVSGGIYVNVMYRYALAARLEFNAGSIMAYDSILKNDPSEGRYRYRRNLQFKSNITELLLLAELHPLPLLFQTNRWRVSPYLVSGIGLFHFNPRGLYHDEWVRLQPLHTEGQGFAEYPERTQYRLTQFNIPAGIGIRYECSALLNIRVEMLYRITQTDYLDDVSTKYIDPALFSKYLAPEYALLAGELHNRQKELDPLVRNQPNAIRGNSSRNDAYFTMQCKLGLIIGRERR